MWCRRIGAWMAVAILSVVATGLRAQEVGKPLPDQQGIYYTLPDGQFVNLRIVDHNLVLYVLDKDGKLLAPPYPKAVVEADSKRRNEKEHVLLLQRDATPRLTSPRYIRPPYVYRMHVLLFPSVDTEDGMVSLPFQDFDQTK